MTPAPISSLRRLAIAVMVARHRSDVRDRICAALDGVQHTRAA